MFFVLESILCLFSKYLHLHDFIKDEALKAHTSVSNHFHDLSLDYVSMSQCAWTCVRIFVCLRGKIDNTPKEKIVLSTLTKICLDIVHDKRKLGSNRKEKN